LRGVDGEVEIVAPLVHLHMLVLVVGRPVEFDADAVFGVPVVLVVESAADGATCLTLGPWQCPRLECGAVSIRAAEQACSGQSDG
jgi:hypothetical protein